MFDVTEIYAWGKGGIYEEESTIELDAGIGDDGFHGIMFKERGDERECGHDTGRPV